jgi:hypothetical protein
MASRLTPVWISLVVVFAGSIYFKRKLGLYGKLFDSPIGMVGFGLVMFWIFAAAFAGLVATHGSHRRHQPDAQRGAGNAAALAGGRVSTSTTCSAATTSGGTCSAG